MTASLERSVPWRRAAAMTLLLVALGGMLVYGGTISPDAGERHYPGDEEVAPSPGAYVGERVTVSGTAVGTDPLRIEVVSDTGETVTLAVRGTDAGATEGDHVSVFGTLQDDATVDAKRAIVREPWELRYMYVVSFLAGLWVLGRTLGHWRLDAGRLAFVPRDGSSSGEGRDA
jgi:hypothetical protein